MYIIIGSLPIAVPVVIVLTDQDRAPQRLGAWKSWFIQNQGRLLGGGSMLLGLLLTARACLLAQAAA